MARAKRAWLPGELHHVIARFVNGEYLMEGDREREQYLARAARSLARTDWLPLAYALMSTHVHFALLAGLAPLDSVFRGLHTGFANWLNGTTGRGGHVFWGRPRTYIVPIEHAGRLIAYIHNNPVRAGVVSSPEQSSWTSHRAYIGADPAPGWLDVDTGLRLCGLESTAAGASAFHGLVVERRHEPRNPAFSDRVFDSLRASTRRALGMPSELGATLVDARSLRADVLVPAHSPLRPVWEGDLRALLDAVAVETGVAVEQMRSRSRRAPVVHARRMALLVGTRLLGRNLVEVAAHVGLAASSATGLLARLDARDRELVASADRICRTLMDGTVE